MSDNTILNRLENAESYSVGLDGNNKSQNTPPASAENAVIAQNLNEIERIREENKNIAIFFWEPSSSLQIKIQEPSYDYLADFEFVIRKEEVDSLPTRGIDILSGLVLSEFHEIAKKYASLVPEDKIYVRFEKTKKQPCPLFHVDRVSLRLICPLRGPGSEWLENSSVERDFLGKGDNQKIVKPDAVIHRADTFQVCLLKGEVYSNLENNKKGIVHRSPPTVGTERWILKMDGKN